MPKPNPIEFREGDWFRRVEGSLDDESHLWLNAVADGPLGRAEAWLLLSWVEVAASEVVRRRSSPLLATSAFALALVSNSGLERRDIAVVASLLRRASALAGTDFVAAVTEGCDRAGAIGQEAKGLILDASPAVPPTHVEIGVGASFLFERLPPDFEVADLERWVDCDGNQS